MTDDTLRRRERIMLASPGDADARARYVHALGFTHGLEQLAKMGRFPELGELDAQGNPDAFEVALAAFVRLVARRRPLIPAMSNRGRRYVGIFDAHRVLCFVDMKGGKVKGSTTRRGDVLRAATWKGPAAHARGSIFDAYGGALAIDGAGIAVELGVLYGCPLCCGWHTCTARSPGRCGT